MEKENKQQIEIQQRAAGAFKLVTMATSAGGLTALSQVLGGLPAEFPAPIVIVQHLDPRHRSLMAKILGKRTKLEAVNRRGKPIKCSVTRSFRQDSDGETEGVVLLMEEVRS